MTTLLLASPLAPASAPRQVQASAPATEAPQVPAKYRELFLDTMNTDLAKIDAALGRQDVLAVLQTMHRMRGALVMVKMNSLSAGFEAVEAQLKRDSADRKALQEAARLMQELRKFLVQV